MLDIRRAGDRGAASFGWLLSRHAFSPCSCFDPQQTLDLRPNELPAR